MTSHRPQSRPDHSLKLVIKQLDSFYVKETPEGNVYDDVPSKLRVLDIPKHVRFDLRDGYIPMSKQEKPLCSFLDEDILFSKGMSNWILKNKDVLQVKSDVESKCLLNTDFITARGLLTRVMITPYSKSYDHFFDDWLVCATKFKGSIYMCNGMTEKQKEKDSNRDEDHNRMIYGGLRFEEYVTSVYDAIMSFKMDRNEKIVHNCVVKSQLCSHSMVYGGEIDCLAKKPQFDDYQFRDFVELKTTKTPKTQENMYWFYVKMLKWWAQCHAIGTPTIVCGFRDNDMVVRDVKTLQVDKMPEKCETVWKPQVCLKYLNWFLSFVKGIVVEDDPTVVYEFHKMSNANIYDIEFRKTNGNERRVLDEEYINSL